jgi:CheY-like chemotaxis protein
VNGLEGRRILVVEDEAVVAAMIQDMLEDLGAQVIGPATSLGRGLALAGAESPDAAVLDVNLRGERIDPVAAVLRDRGVPLVFASGYGESGISAGPREAVLEKPFKLDDLRDALLRVLASPAR